MRTLQSMIGVTIGLFCTGLHHDPGIGSQLPPSPYGALQDLPPRRFDGGRGLCEQRGECVEPTLSEAPVAVASGASSTQAWVKTASLHALEKRTVPVLAVHLLCI